MKTIRGKINNWKYTRSGYQITTIDGVSYKTLFDLGEFGGKLQPGVSVEFEISQSKSAGDPYPELPYARILRAIDKR